MKRLQFKQNNTLSVISLYIIWKNTLVTIISGVLNAMAALTVSFLIENRCIFDLKYNRNCKL